MAAASGVTLEIDVGRGPAARRRAGRSSRGNMPGGGRTNRQHFGAGRPRRRPGVDAMSRAALRPADLRRPARRGRSGARRRGAGGAGRRRPAPGGRSRRAAADRADPQVGHRGCVRTEAVPARSVTSSVRAAQAGSLPARHRAEWYKLTFVCRSKPRLRACAAVGGGVLPDLSVLWVIFFVLRPDGLLDRLLFRPVLRVMQQREEAIHSARELAERSAHRGARRDGGVRAEDGGGARRDLPADGRDAPRPRSAERAEILAQTRARGRGGDRRGLAQLQAEAEEARRRLAADAERSAPRPPNASSAARRPDRPSPVHRSTNRPTMPTRRASLPVLAAAPAARGVGVVACCRARAGARTRGAAAAAAAAPAVPHDRGAAADGRAAEAAHGSEHAVRDTIAKLVQLRASWSACSSTSCSAPIAGYLAGRSAQIRQDLVTAAEMRATAARAARGDPRRSWRRCRRSSRR